MIDNYDNLELYKIIDNLIELSNLNITKEKFIDLKIIKDKSELAREMNLMIEFIDLYKYDNGLHLEGLNDIRKYIKSLTMIGIYLESEEVLNIKNNLSIYRRIRNKASKLKDKYKMIWSLVSDVEELKIIEESIDEIIDEEGNIKDVASFTLKDIRRQKININTNIKEKFDNLMNDKELQRAIQEKFITTRNDRYVIAVKTEFKSMIKGIEHDRSSTGSTVYIEPLNIVSLNNKLREYQIREREEIRKILIRITEIIKVKKDEILNIIEILERIDFLNAKTIYSINNKANVPKLVNKMVLHLVQARHPLIDKDIVVPLDFNLQIDDNIMLITGPNTGGKTVTLKVAGLLTIMALSGIPITAHENTEIGYFNNVLADIGDEQSIEQNLSSFSGHVSRLKKILEVANSKTLVLLDELGSGTDPMEGSAFAMAIIDYLNENNIKSIITTHYSEVKAHAFNNVGIKSASMEFDINTLSPTYRLLEGIPGESNALIIATKYGIDYNIISKAQSYISEDNQKVEQMIKSIKEKNDELKLLNENTEILKQELEIQKKEYELKVLEFEEEKNKILKNSFVEAEEYLGKMQTKAKNLIEKISKDELSKEEAKNIQRNLNMLRESIKIDKKSKIVEKEIKLSDINYAVNEEVLLKTLNQNAKILRIMPNNNTVQVQAGILKLVVSINDIAKIRKNNKIGTKRLVATSIKPVKTEIDVRGMIANDAIRDIELYLDKSILSGYNTVYIIHGKGTMVLRKKIREYLSTSHYVSDYKDANQNEGGTGCTIVTLK